MLCDHDFNLRNPSTSYSASAEAILGLPLAKLGPEVSDRMKRLAGYWARHQPVSVPLQWTTRLPSDIAIATRRELAESLQNGATERNGATDDLLRDAVPTFRQWLQTAPLGEKEKASLLGLLESNKGK